MSFMPQLIALAVVGAGLVAGARFLSKVVVAMTDDLRRAEAEARVKATPKDLGTLTWDPEAGVYRPGKG
jgi:hypothetical protein